MICPRCSVAEISPVTHACELCGYMPGTNAAVDVPRADATDALARRELAHQFQIDVLLGHGDASAVYLAREAESSRHIILKVVPRHAGSAEADGRFRDAVLAAQALHHPHLVPVLRHGVTDSLLWYTMEPVRGRPLRDVLRATQRMDLRTTQRITAQIASALDYLHRRGLSHGALKPQNVLIDPDGWAHVCDALIPRALTPVAPRRSSAPDAAAVPGEGGPAEAPRGRRSGAAPRPPESGATPRNSLEAGADAMRGPAADQQALALVVLECLTGQPASPGADPGAILAQARPDLPPHVGFALQRATADNLSARFPGALDFVTALESGVLPLAEARPTGRSSAIVFTDPGWVAPPQRRWKRYLAAALALLALAGAAWGVSVMIQRSNRPTYQQTILGRITPAVPDSAAAAAAAAAAPSPAPATTRPSAPPSRAPTVAAPPARSTAPVAEPAPQRPEPRPQRAQNPAPEPAPAAPAGAIGKLFVNASPWGQVFVDGASVGNTPKANLPVTAGTHRIRVVREGYEPFERTITVGAGETVRLTDIVLTERK